MSANGKKSKNFIIGIAVAVLLPLFLYLLVDNLSKGKVKMPSHYRPEGTRNIVIRGKNVVDTVYHKVADITLTNQVNERHSLNNDLKDKILVLNFIFTDCTATCPKLSESMRKLQKSFAKDPKKEATLESKVRFVTITVLPERDSVPRLRAYADRYGANPDRWWFMTGDKKAIYNYMKNELGLSAGEGDGGADDFIHTDKLVLLDQDRNIRGYYSGLADTSARRCADDIVLLTMERKHR